MISFDTETRNLRWWEGSAFLATWAGPDHELYEPLVDHPTDQRRRSELHVFLEALANSEVLIAHNA
jgi:hypothetical protein